MHSTSKRSSACAVVPYQHEDASAAMTTGRIRYVGRPADEMKRPKLTFSSCVDSIKKGFKRLSGAYDHVAAGTKQSPGVPAAAAKPRGLAKQDSCKANSFETYLRALPKLDPLDRTVGWVFHQTEETGAVRKISFSKLPPRGSVKPNPAPSDHIPDASCLDTSLSRYESERGTLGRGTPPSYDSTRPRLDELCRRLQTRVGASDQEAAGRDLLPLIAARKAPAVAGAAASLVQKNASHWNRGVGVAPLPAEKGGARFRCEWLACGVAFASHRELYSHVEACHVPSAPFKLVDPQHGGRGDLLCRWRACPEGTRAFAARYKLLLHVQGAHCRGEVDAQGACYKDQEEWTRTPVRIGVCGGV